MCVLTDRLIDRSDDRSMPESPSPEKDLVIRRRELIASYYVTNRPLGSPRKELPEVEQLE